jgi:hypothetical protein
MALNRLENMSFQFEGFSFQRAGRKKMILKKVLAMVCIGLQCLKSVRRRAVAIDKAVRAGLRPLLP